MFAVKRFARTCNFGLSAVSKVRNLSLSSSVSMPVKVGDKLPAVDLFENDPGTKVNTGELFGKGKSIIVAVPGAFTPTCHKDHVPTFVKTFSDLKAKGVDRIVCVAVNDPFVMAEWGKSLGADGKIKMLADTCADFSKKLDLTIDATAILGNVRSKRYVMVVTDGVVTGLNVEPDGTGLSCSRAADVLTLL